MITDKERIVEEYNNANKSGKQLLEKIYGKEYFVEPYKAEKIKSYTDIETLQDALEGLGYDRNSEIPVIKALQEQIASVLAESILDIADIACLKNTAEMVVIAKALNKDYKTGKLWRPDWSNSSEYKYYPWFKMCSGGFSLDVVNLTYAGSIVGSRLVFKSEEISQWAGKKFTEKYKIIFTYPDKSSEIL